MCTLANKIFELAGSKWYAKEPGRLAMNCLAFLVDGCPYRLCFTWTHGICGVRDSGLEDEVAELLARSVETPLLPEANPEFVQSLLEIFHVEDDPEHKLINAHLMILAADKYFRDPDGGTRQQPVGGNEPGPYLVAFKIVTEGKTQEEIVLFLDEAHKGLQELIVQFQLAP